MYRPNFCAECSAKIIRLRWHFWTSGRFCGRCAPRFLKEQITRALIIIGSVFLLGMVAGQAARRSPPALVIQRAQNNIGSTDMSTQSGSRAMPSDSKAGNANTSGATTEEIYTCGARTRKGTPCTRRVHGAVRCWQHLGLPPMLPQEQLRVQSR